MIKTGKYVYFEDDIFLGFEIVDETNALLLTEWENSATYFIKDEKKLYLVNRYGFYDIYEINENDTFQKDFGEFIYEWISDEEYANRTKNENDDEVVKEESVEKDEDVLCPDELKVFGMSVLKSLQEENFSAYKKHFWTEQDVDKMAKYAKTDTDKTEIEKEKVRKLASELENNFNNILAEGKEIGFDWSKVEVYDFFCDIKVEEEIRGGVLIGVIHHNDVSRMLTLWVVGVKDEWWLFNETELMMLLPKWMLETPR